ncbi:MAG TPA: HAD-IIIA family hydrolase [Tepidisphaeraceae bacterium]|jgi:D-glycero-D-manno-heptose 1,7-bisphosphate phosphatase|nr:HAD-IIIA family hydrolase [Tepidisphaeraceae bacterium]
MRRAVFLDRDGVLIRTFIRNGVPHPPQTLDEVKILPGVPEALARLRDLGFLLLVVTNQPDVPRKTQTRQMVNAINDHLRDNLPLDGVYVCFHDNADHCTCRKPAPGMLLQAAAEHEIDMPSSFMVGDRASDVAAGAAAGCRTFLVEHPYSHAEAVKPTFKAADLLEVADCISAECNARDSR